MVQVVADLDEFVGGALERGFVNVVHSPVGHPQFDSDTTTVSVFFSKDAPESHGELILGRVHALNLLRESRNVQPTRRKNYGKRKKNTPQTSIRHYAVRGKGVFIGELGRIITGMANKLTPEAALLSEINGEIVAQGMRRTTFTPKTGFSYGKLNDILTGETVAKFHDLTIIAKALGVPLVTLMQRAQERHGVEF